MNFKLKFKLNGQYSYFDQAVLRLYTVRMINIILHVNDIKGDVRVGGEKGYSVIFI